MTHEHIPLPPAVRRIVDLLIATVTGGVYALTRRFGDATRRSNADAFADVSWARTKLRRLARILRYVFLILAVRVDVVPARADGRSGRCASRTACPRFTLTTSLRSHAAAGGTQPAHLAAAPRDTLRSLQRGAEALTRALAEPMRHVRRLARLLRRDFCVLAWRPPKRNPPLGRRDYCEDMAIGHGHASFELAEFRRRDSS